MFPIYDIINIHDVTTFTCSTKWEGFLEHNSNMDL